jgi:single-strand selective monofunctional uracil DNA glycosylase
MSATDELVAAARDLRRAVCRLRFAPPVAYQYNPLEYAWEPHKSYLEKWGGGPKQVVFLGMNPGPWGMAQVGVPFGEIAHVRDWIGITGEVTRPEREHPKRPVEGFACKRSEVSGRRLWGYFAQRFGTAEAFFNEHFVANYCPLAFLEESGRNRTPDKLPADERDALHDACDRHLRRVVSILEPRWVVGVGGFARIRAEAALAGVDVHFGRVLHPSPASPAANRGWAEAAERQLVEQGIW